MRPLEHLDHDLTAHLGLQIERLGSWTSAEIVESMALAFQSLHAEGLVPLVLLQDVMDQSPSFMRRQWAAAQVAYVIVYEARGQLWARIADTLGGPPSAAALALLPVGPTGPELSLYVTDRDGQSALSKLQEMKRAHEARRSVGHVKREA